MKRRQKQLIEKHIKIIKNKYPELFIKVIEVGDDILVSIDSLEISNEVEYETLICGFIKEYDKKGYFDVFWGVDTTLTCDNLSLLEDAVKIPEAEKSENFKGKKAANF